MKPINKTLILFGVFFLLMIIAGNNWGWLGILILIIRFLMSKASSGKSTKKEVSNETIWNNNHTVKEGISAKSKPPVIEKKNLRGRGSGKLPKKGEITWVPSGQPLIIGDYNIAGAVYVTSKAERWGGESSAIDLNARLSTPAPPEQFNPSYYPAYSQLDAREKASYLEWLQKGMYDEEPYRRDLGYIFLYFYGIERRVFLDQDNDISLLDRAEHLLRNYGQANAKKTFVTYLSEFLHFSYYRKGAKVYRGHWYKLIPLHEEKMSEMILKMILANLHELGEALEWTLAYRIAKFHSDSKRSVVVNRSGEKFFKLFEKKYNELYPKGLTLKSGKRDALIRYRPASMSLDELQRSELSEYIPNVYGLASQFKKLPQIWNACVDELSGYSRAVRNIENQVNPCDESALKAFLALPQGIRSIKEHPMLSVYEEVLGEGVKEEALTFVPVSRIAKLLGFESRSTLTVSQSKKVACLVESFGMTLAPHPVHTQINLRWEQEVAILDQRSYLSKNSDLISGALRLMYLTIIVAAADGEVDDKELIFFRRILEGVDFNQSERVELDATFCVLLRDTNIALKNLNKIARSIKQDRRGFVFNHVLDVAAADEEITREEIKILKRVGKAMGMSDVYMNDLISKKEQSFKVVPVTIGDKTKINQKGEAIPKQEDSLNEMVVVTKPFSLDTNKIAEITADTNEVISILADVLRDDEFEEQATEVSIDKHEINETIDNEEVAYEGLDQMYHKALQKILSASEWTIDELKQELKHYHLMQAAFVDAVNDWADEDLGDFLIEIDGDRVIIYNKLLQEAI